MDQIGVLQLLDDLRCIKTSDSARSIINVYIKKSNKMHLSLDDIVAIKKIAKRYRKKIFELNASREAARNSSWRFKNRVTIAEAEQLVQERLVAVEQQEADLGI